MGWTTLTAPCWVVDDLDAEDGQAHYSCRSEATCAAQEWVAERNEPDYPRPTRPAVRRLAAPCATAKCDTCGYISGEHECAGWHYAPDEDLDDDMAELAAGKLACRDCQPTTPLDLRSRCDGQQELPYQPRSPAVSATAPAEAEVRR